MKIENVSPVVTRRQAIAGLLLALLLSLSITATASASGVGMLSSPNKHDAYATLHAR